VALCVMAPLHGVAPILAEANQAHVLGEGALHVLVARAPPRVPRRDLQEFEWIVEFGYTRDLEPPASYGLQPVHRLSEVGRTSPEISFDDLGGGHEQAIAVGLAVAKGLGWDESATLGFMFRWRKLKGRRLDSWANPIVYVPGGGPTQQDEMTTFIDVPLTTAPNALASLVEAATRDLFVTFDGTRISKETYEEQSRRLLERRLGS
jgi:hypothetical protein